MFFNIPLLTAEQMHTWCQSLQNLGHVGREHIVIKRDSLNRFVPTLSTKPKSICSRIYKPKNQRLTNSFGFLLNFLNANEKSLLDPKFAAQNLEMIVKIDAYFSTKSSQLKNFHQLSLLSLKFKSVEIVPTVSKTVEKAKEQAKSEIKKAKQTTEQMSAKFSQEKQQLNEELDKLVTISGKIDGLSSSLETTGTTIIDRETTIFKDIKNAKTKDLTLKFKQNGQDAELQVHRILYLPLFRVKPEKDQKVIDFSKFSAEAVRALENFIYLKKVDALEWAHLSEFYDSFHHSVQQELMRALSSFGSHEKLAALKTVKEMYPEKGMSLLQLYLKLNPEILDNFDDQFLGMLEQHVEKERNPLTAYAIGKCYAKNKDYPKAIYFLGLALHVQRRERTDTSRKANEECFKILSSLSPQDEQAVLNYLHDFAEKDAYKFNFCAHLLCAHYSKVPVENFKNYPRLLTENTKTWLIKLTFSIAKNSNILVEDFDNRAHYLLSQMYLNVVGGPTNFPLAALYAVCAGTDTEDSVFLDKVYELLKKIPIKEVLKVFESNNIRILAALTYQNPCNILTRKFVHEWSGIDFFDQFPEFLKWMNKVKDKIFPFGSYWQAIEMKRSGLNKNNQNEFIELLLSAGYAEPSEELTKLCFAELKQVLNIEEMNTIAYPGNDPRIRLFLTDYIHDEKDLKLEGTLDSDKTKYWLARVSNNPNFKYHSKKAQLILERNIKYIKI